MHRIAIFHLEAVHGSRAVFTSSPLRPRPLSTPKCRHPSGFASKRIFCCCFRLKCSSWNLNMGVSKNMGKPTKSSILTGFSILNHPFWGTPIFGNIHINQKNSINHIKATELYRYRVPHDIRCHIRPKCRNIGHRAP